MSTLIKTILLVLDELFYFVFPLSEDERMIRKLSHEDVTQKLNVQYHQNCTVLTPFADGEIRALLHLVKFHRHPRAIALSALLLESWLNTNAPSSSVIIPIPLSKERERNRGYNQVELIARSAVRNLPQHHINTGILVRTRDTKPQTSLKRTERIKNMVGAFTISSSAPKLHEAHVILIDDVMTTGATLQAAKLAMSSLSPKSITCVAIAH